MAYFNHAFRKMFLATGETQLAAPVLDLAGNPITADTNGALLDTSGLSSTVLNQLSQLQKSGGAPLTSGYVGIFDPKAHTSYTQGDLTTCCPIYIAGSAIQSNDKIGPFHGGYTETNKSKTINPKYVSRLYTQDACPASADVVNIGSTPFNVGGAITSVSAPTAGGTGYTPGTYNVTATGSVSGIGAVFLIVVNALGVVTDVTVVATGSGYILGEELTIVGGNNDATFDVNSVNAAAGNGSCCATFLCDETYSLRLDIKGSPALRFLNRNTYLTVDAYTGCCDDDDITPTPVDSTLVFIEWARQIVNSPLISPFVKLVVIAQDGTILYDPATSPGDLAQTASGLTWDDYVSPGYIEDACGGLIIEGAYVDTKFGDCTFQSTDFFEKEPVLIYASLMDLNGDPCEFEGLCVIKECNAKQAEGFGEQVIRDLILSESYRQNFFHSDLRIREITQGNQMLTDVNRDAQYDRLYLLHSVPRFNNPSSTFDNDQYLLEFVGLAGSGSLTALIETLNDWLTECGVCEIEAFECSAPCEVIVNIPPFVSGRRGLQPPLGGGGTALNPRP
jgi:hypothetical protein